MYPMKSHDFGIEVMTAANWFGMNEYNYVHSRSNI